MTQKLFPGLLLLAIALAPAISAREWTNAAGKRFEAELVSSDATHVQLKRPGGKILRVARDQLSEEDRNWLDRQAGQPAGTAAAPPVASPASADEIARSLEALGAKVDRDDDDPQHPIVAVDLHGLQIMDGHLALLDGLKSLKRLDLSSCYMTASDAGLAHLATLSGLEELTLYNALQGSDRLLAPLADLTNLKSLNLDIPAIRFFPVIHDSGIANLKQLVKLERLRISNMEITDKSMPYLEQMTNLRELELIGTKVSRTGIATLKNFPHLRKLIISSDASLTDDSMEVLADLSELESLTLSGQRFTGEVLKHVRAPKLRDVEIAGPFFGDEVFPYLQTWSNLEHVRFYDAAITDEGLAALNQLNMLKTLELIQCTVNGPGLMELKELGQLQTLRIAGYAMLPQPDEYKLKPDVLQCLEHFPHLETLDFNRTFVGNRGMAYLKHVPKLKNLQLAAANINDDAMIHLESLDQLESLNLAFDKVVEPGLAHLTGMKKLRRLVIPCRVTDAGLKHIAQLTALRELDLTSAPITDEGMPLLAQLTQLEKLNLLYCTQITGKGFESLTALTGLRELKLMGDHVDDQIVSQLAKLQALRELVLLNTRVTGAGIDGLGALPNLRRLFLFEPDRAAVRRLYERNLGLIVLSHAEAPLLRGAKW